MANLSISRLEEPDGDSSLVVSSSSSVRECRRDSCASGRRRSTCCTEDARDEDEVCVTCRWLCIDENPDTVINVNVDRRIAAQATVVLGSSFTMFASSCGGACEKGFVLICLLNNHKVKI